MASTLRLQRLFIEKIFGEGSHDIDVRFNLEERVTILHGLNGSGKTITLQLLDAVLKGEFEAILKYPLTKFMLEFEGGGVLELTPMHQVKQDAPPAESKRGEVRTLGLRWRIRCGPQGNWTEGRLDAKPTIFWRKRRIARLIPDELPMIRQIGPDEFADMSRGDSLSLDELPERCGHRLSRGSLFSHLADRQHGSQVVQDLGSPPALKLIPTDRLYFRGETRSDHACLYEQPEPSKSRLMVQHLAEQMRSEVAAADQAYRTLSSQLDGSLPRRLIDLDAGAPEAEAEALQARSREINEMEERLWLLGLLSDRAPQLPSEIPKEKRATIQLLLQDRARKLAPFLPIADKAARLVTTLNRKLAPKRIQMNMERGYQVFAASGKEIPLDKLSSGEQHELVLLHELLFELKPGTLVLIDEPELSLHVTWQQTFVDDMLDIARIAELDFVLATHSPYIADKHDRLMVRLGHPPRGAL